MEYNMEGKNKSYDRLYFGDDMLEEEEEKKKKEEEKKEENEDAKK